MPTLRKKYSFHTHCTGKHREGEERNTKGEKNEEPVFCANSTFLEVSDGGWKEHDKEIKETFLKGDAQKVLLDCIYPDIKPTIMDKKGQPPTQSHNKVQQLLYTFLITPNAIVIITVSCSKTGPDGGR